MIVDIVFGFLGSGKTTFITRIINEWGQKEKIVVLVNEFGDVGIDGEVLKDKGGNVVEMPSGCICCTLQADFKKQLLEIIAEVLPQRIVIEPTGVATIGQIRQIVEGQAFEDVISVIHNVLVVDAAGFMGLYKANRHFVESQVKSADVVLLNKVDLVDKRMSVVTRDAISSINPESTVLMTQYGSLDWGQYSLALSSPRAVETAPTPESHELIDHETRELRLISIHPERDALGYESFGQVYEDIFFDQEALGSLFNQMTTDSMGEIVRAKGIFQVGERWVLIELSSGEVSFQPIQKSDRSKISIIGKSLNKELLGSAIEECVKIDLV